MAYCTVTYRGSFVKFDQYNGQRKHTKMDMRSLEYEKMRKNEPL